MQCPEGDLGTQYPIGFCREIQMGRQCWHPPLHPCHNHMDVETIVLWRMRNKCHLEGVEALQKFILFLEVVGSLLSLA
jgi:hypothetical protein